ncbi:hypothetical protein SELMODRAFT_427793 [Selaginella moellendorffii]|uniref:Uncharacterized protein n=1 Tax=Selaginella moellendorffii TaxID=88036 RepID=D8T0Q5_SELML|nr:uncharacterized protein LOC9630294 [Selaginella moellendorffii]EFJ09747.1 hypothetical protein SELMODRAFT_427793 [Selaginella moellendorffii]|eukprot:XP_002989153.1 uncharacterized protein LOC9630294 [Selaginella moellendorffii]
MLLRRGIQAMRARIAPGARWSSNSSSSSSAVPEDSDWWMVEGELLSVQEIRTVKKKGEDDAAPSPGQQRYTRVNHLSTFRIDPQKEDQRLYWKAYMNVYEKARDEWEKVVWDEPNVVRRVEDYFFDEPLAKKRKKPKSGQLERKPFSMEEIQAAIRENVRHPTSDKKIEYRTAEDTKWPF